jgi:predicted nuclease of predicted toxin-antitoxin system
MEFLVDACVARRLRDFNPQNLANTINGESRRFWPASLVELWLRPV